MRCFLKSVISLVFIVALSSRPAFSDSVSEVVFSSGAMPQDYQPVLVSALLKEAFSQHGIQFKTTHNPSLRSLRMANTGEVDGELHRVYEFHEVSNGAYPNLMRIDSKLLSVWLTAYAKQDYTINTWDDLKGKKVAYYRGRKNVEAYLKAVMNKNNIVVTDDDYQAFKMLNAGRVDIVISEGVQGRCVLTELALGDKVSVVARLKETKIYAYINNKHKDLVSLIKSTLDQMKVTGRFNEITSDVNKWFDMNG